MNKLPPSLPRGFDVVDVGAERASVRFPYAVLDGFKATFADRKWDAQKRVWIIPFIDLRSFSEWAVKVAPEADARRKAASDMHFALIGMASPTYRRRALARFCKLIKKDR